MVKKKNVKVSESRPGPGKKGKFDPEYSKWFVPLAFLVIFLALVVLFSEFLFSDKMLRGSDMIQAGIYHRAFYVNYFLEHGKVPQWDPHAFGGMPFVEAFHGDIFYPLSILKFFGSIFRMLGMVQILHIFLAGLFMYFCARQFKLSKVASLFSAVCYMFAPYLVSYVAPGHDGKIFVTTLFPLVILFLERGFQKQPFLNFSFLGLVIGVIILSPHPQLSYFMLWVVAFYSLFKLLRLYFEKRALVPLIRPGLLVAYAVVLGLLLSAIQFYPGYYYTTHFSPRADVKKGWDWATSWSMHEEDVFSILIPEFAGVSTQEAETYYWGKNAFKDNSESVGVVAFFAALIGLLFARRKEAYFFGALALFALFYALADTTPIFKIFFYLIPKVSSMRAASMIMFIFSFSIALLAGMGIQYVQEKKREKRETTGKYFNYLLFGLPSLMFLLALLFNVSGKGMLSGWCSFFYSEAAATMVQQGISKLDVAYMNLPAIQSGAWFAFLFSALTALFIWLYRAGKAGAGILVILVLVPLIYNVRFDKRFIGVFDNERYWAKNPLVSFFTQKNDKFRVLDLNDPKSLVLPYFGIDVLIGYHGNQLRWYDDLLGSIEMVNRTNPFFLNLAGVKYLLLSTGQNIPPNYFGEKTAVTAATFGTTRIVENNNAFPRVYLCDRYKVVPDRQDIYPIILKGEDDFREVVYLEKEPVLPVYPDSLKADSAWIKEYDYDSVLVGLSCAANNILVMTDNYFDAWQVLIDGRPAELLRAYGTFRAVAVPAGAGEILFKYDSPRYKTGRLVTWLTSFYLLAVVVFHMFRSRKKNSKEKEISL